MKRGELNMVRICVIAFFINIIIILLNTFFFKKKKHLSIRLRLNLH